MTTYYTGPTPYDAKIVEAGMQRQEATSKVYRDVLLDKLGRLEGKREGYRQAKTEDAALLEAAKDMLAAIQRLRLCPKCKEQECDCWQQAAQAITQAEGKE